MFEDEKDYFEALGLEAPQGEEEQEPAEPAEEEIPEEEIDEAEPEEQAEEPEEEPEEPAEEKQPQTKEERARNAARRRQQEREDYARQAAEKARAEVRDEVRSLFEQAGFRDGDAPITSLEEMRAYLEKQQAGKLAKELKAGKLSPESLQQLVAQEVRRMQPEPKQDDGFMRQVESELAEIRKYDPNIREVKDLLTMDRKDAFLDAVRNHGYGYLDAYRFVYADRIAGRSARQEAQRTINNERSKNHLRASGAKGTGDVAVPAAVERNIRALMPKASAKEIREYYRRDAKRFG